jgi:hypothetical protein
MIQLASNLASAAAQGAAGALGTQGADGAPPALAAVTYADVLVLSLDPGAVLGGALGARGTGRPQRSGTGTGYAGAKASAPAGTTAKGSTSTSSTKSTSASSASSSTSTSSSSALAFLADSKLSVEEKLYRFMLYVSDKYDKALEKKMNEIAGKQTSSSSSGSKSKGGGLLGGLFGGSGGGIGGLLGGALKTVLPAAGIGLDLLKSTGIQDLITQASGPVLAAGATAMGFPALAPVLLKAGPALAKGLFSAAGNAAGGSSSSSSSSGASEKGVTYSSADDPQIEQKDMLELQHLQDKQKEMFSLISNLLRSMHDTKMAVINNLRT